MRGNSGFLLSKSEIKYSGEFISSLKLTNLRTIWRMGDFEIPWTKLECSCLIHVLLPALCPGRALCDLLVHETFPQMTPYNLPPLKSSNQNILISFPIIAVFIYDKKQRCIDLSCGKRNERLSSAKLISNWENDMLMTKPWRKEKKKQNKNTHKRKKHSMAVKSRFLPLLETPHSLPRWELIQIACVSCGFNYRESNLHTASPYCWSGV